MTSDVGGFQRVVGLVSLRTDCFFRREFMDGIFTGEPRTARGGQRLHKHPMAAQGERNSTHNHCRMGTRTRRVCRWPYLPRRAIPLLWYGAGIRHRNAAKRKAEVAAATIGGEMSSSSCFLCSPVCKYTVTVCLERVSVRDGPMRLGGNGN